MKDNVFLDTNIFIYTQSMVEAKKREISLDTFNRYDCCVSTQVLNEVSNVMIKKLKMKTYEIKQVIEAIYSRCEIYVVNYETVQKALDLRERYNHSFYDSLILVSALESGCQRILTEDMQNGQIIEGKLQIVNPFVIQEDL